MKSALIEQHTASEKKIAKVELSTIQTRGLQTRESTDRAKVAEYAEIYRAGGAMPPIVVFSDGGDEFYLADGHHRLAAAAKAELAEIEAIIRKGDRRAALWYATAANAEHGLPRTNDDKRRAVSLILADEEWRAYSDSAIAEHAKVSDRLVAKVRKEIGAEVTATRGKDGKVRKKPARKPQPEPTDPAATDLPTWAQIEAIDSTASVASKRGPLRGFVVLFGRRYSYLSSDLIRVFTPTEFAYGYPGAKVGRYGEPDIVDAEKGYLGLRVQHRGTEYILGGVRDEIHIRRPAECQPTDRIALTAADLPIDPRERRILQTLASDQDVNGMGLDDQAISQRLNLPLAMLGLLRDMQAAGRIAMDADSNRWRITPAGLRAIGLKPARPSQTPGENAPSTGEKAPATPPPAPPSAPPTQPAAGPEDLTLGDIAPAGVEIEPPAAAPRVQQSAGEDLFAGQAAAGATDPHRANLRPLGLRRVDKQREILQHKLMRGKTTWTGTDGELLTLALLAGVPTRPVAWIDPVKAQARDLFINALRAEVADRVRTGDAMNARAWPQLAELCRLWGLDHEAIIIEAERAVPE